MSGQELDGLSVRHRTLMAAAESVGGITQLAEALGVERRLVLGWIGGFSQMPEDVFLQCLDVVLRGYDALAKSVAAKQ